MKRFLFTVMKVWLEFDTIKELQSYKESNKDKGWKFIEEYKNNDFFTLIVEKPYGKYNAKM